MKTGKAGTKKMTEFEKDLARRLKDDAFRKAYEQRQFIHEIAIAVRGMREDAMVTQSQLAEMIGTSQSVISRLEKGKDQRVPRWDTLKAIARVLGKQLKLSFVDGPDSQGPVVEINGKPATERLTENRV